MLFVIFPDFFHSGMAEIHDIAVLGENASDVLANIVGIHMETVLWMKLLPKAGGGQRFVVESAGIHQAVEAAADRSRQVVGGQKSFQLFILAEDTQGRVIGSN